jgi:hypothetical protein
VIENKKKVTGTSELQPSKPFGSKNLWNTSNNYIKYTKRSKTNESPFSIKYKKKKMEA